MHNCALSPLTLVQNLKHFQKLPSSSAKTKHSPSQLTIVIRDPSHHRCSPLPLREPPHCSSPLPLHDPPTIVAHRCPSMSPTITVHCCPSVTLRYALLLLFIHLSESDYCMRLTTWMAFIPGHFPQCVPIRPQVSAVDPTLLPRRWRCSSEVLIYVSAFPKFTSRERLPFVLLPVCVLPPKTVPAPWLSVVASERFFPKHVQLLFQCLLVYVWITRVQPQRLKDCAGC